MWTIWSDQNWRAFEDEEKTMVQLLEFCQRTLFDWSRYWGFSDCSTLMDFISSIRIDYGMFCLVVSFSIVHSRELFVFLLLFFF